MNNKRREVKSFDKDGNEKIVWVVTPTEDERDTADILSKKKFAKLMNELDENGNPTVLLRARIYECAKKQGIWGEEQEHEKKRLAKTINNNLEILQDKGGIKLSEARELAIETYDLRMQMTALESDISALKANSIESQCEDVEYDYLLICAIKDDEGNPVFDTVEDYKHAEAHPWIVEACKVFSEMYYGLDSNWMMTLPENEFLKKYNFLDDEGNFTNRDGEKVDRAGNLLKDVSEEEKPEPLPFLDDEGNPIT